MRDLPDPHLSLRDASDFVFDSDLGRKALTDPNPRNLAILVREVVALIYRLTASCQLPEFTDHGLPHLCSLIDRISRWTVVPTGGAAEPLLNKLSASEAGQLLLATLFHDIGMLSQRPEDLPGTVQAWEAKGVRDIPLWVRSTHIARMGAVLRRSFAGTQVDSAMYDTSVVRAMAIASGHGYWPWDPHIVSLAPREAGMASVLAIADLLDEDANRCDIRTLLNHRYGTHLNCAHWIRHGLTSGRVLVAAGEIGVELARPPGTDGQMGVVFSALRNHFRLALLYQRELHHIGAGLLRVSFNQSTGCPTREADQLAAWAEVPGFSTQGALIFHLLSSFMSYALLDDRIVNATDLARINAVGMEHVDLAEFYRIRGVTEPRSGDEQAFRAITG